MTHGMTLKKFCHKPQTGVVNLQKTFPTLIVLATSMLSAAPLATEAKRQAMAMAQMANAKQTSAYMWKQRITVVRKGESMEPSVQEIRFDASGQPVRSTIAKPEEKRMGPLRARKVAEIKESIQETMQLAFRYATPQSVGAALRQGEIWEGPGGVKVLARPGIVPADEMEVQVSVASMLATLIEIKTFHAASPVRIAIVYEQFPNGPSMMRRMTVRMPEEDIVVHVESFDFVRLAGPTIH